MLRRVLALSSLLLAPALASPLLAADEVLFTGDQEFRNLQPGFRVVGEAISETTEEGEHMEAQMRPTLKLQNLRAGGDVRLIYSTPGGLEEGVDASKALLSIAFVDYAEKNVRARYSPLASVTFGHGLLVNRFTTNERKAYFAGAEGPQGALYLMTTDTHLHLARLRLDLKGDLKLGFTYVQDDERVFYAPHRAYAIDFQIPLRVLNFKAYGEFAHLQGYGSGLAAGVFYEAGQGRLQWRHQLAQYQAGFVPGFYDAYYELQPAYLPAVQSRTGLSSQVTIRPLDWVVAQASLVKNEGERASLHAEAAAKFFENLSAAITLDAKNYGGKVERTDNTLYKAKVIYGANENMDLILEYNLTYPDENAATRDAIEYTLLKTRFKL